MVFVVRSSTLSEASTHPDALMPADIVPTESDDLGAIDLEGSGFENEVPLDSTVPATPRQGNN